MIPMTKTATNTSSRIPSSTRTGASGAILGVGQPAVLQREAATPDAVPKPVAQAFELGDALVDPPRPGAGQSGPVGPLGHAIVRQAGELGADLGQRQSDLLGEDNERDSTQRRARVAAVAGAGALGGDEAFLLIEAQRRGGDAAAARDLGDGQELGHGSSMPEAALDFKLT